MYKINKYKMLASNRQKYHTLTILFNTIDYLIISRDITIFVYGIFHFFPDPFFFLFLLLCLIDNHHCKF